MRKLRDLAGVGRHRVAMPQDEFLYSRSLVSLIGELDIDHVFSVAPESEWDTLYAGWIASASGSPGC